MKLTSVVTFQCLEPKRNVQEQLHALPNVRHRALVEFLLAVAAGGVIVRVVLVQRLAGERGPERRARAELGRAPPLAVARADGRCRRGADCAEQDRAHLAVGRYLHLMTYIYGLLTDS